MKPRIRVLIVDDHAMVRLGLAEAIDTAADLALVGEAENGAEALRLYAQHKPDVVVMDFQLPGRDGAEITADLRAQFPGARVLLFSVFEGEEDIWRAMQGGAAGYLIKSADTPTIVDAIRRVGRGEAFLPQPLAAKLDARRSRGSLTPRELEVLRLIVHGRSNKEILSTLHISESSVKLHVSNILAKLRVADRTQAAIEAVRRGIVHLE
jgi:DNA-binding NarL/FixJ family response regulator